jgi:hypothetical protein
MHSGVRVGVGEFQKVVAIEIWNFFSHPLILKFVQITVHVEIFPEFNWIYFESSA